MATEEVGLRLSLQGRREAAAGLSDVKGELEGVADAGQDVETAGKAAARGLDRASDRRFARGFAAIGRGAVGLTSTIGRGLLSAGRMGARGLGILAVAATAVSVKSIALASDARETASAFNTVFGPSARGVAKDLGALTYKFGLYNPELKDATRQFGVFGKAAGVSAKELPGFSTSLVKAGLDLSSFYNTDPGETFKALQSGLSGEAEPLRKFGIFISQATLEAKAASMGLTDELTEQQKVMVRQKIIMGSLGDAQGDLARTSDGFANQQRGASGRMKSFFTMLGGPLTTAATGAFKGFNAIAKVGISELRDRLPDLEKKAQKASRTFTRWGRTLAHDLPGAIKTVGKTWDRFSDRITSFSAGDAGDQLGVLSDNITELGPALREVGTELPGIKDLLTVTNVVTGFLADHTDLLAKAVPYLVAGYVALKVSQLAANVVLAATLPLKVAELLTNRSLVKSNRELVASRAANTVATTTEATATVANTTAQSGGILARVRAIAGIVAHRVAMVAGAVATGVITAAQWLFNAALSANPIGIVIVAVAALAAGFYMLYQKSDTFRGIINTLWNSVLKPFGAFIGGIFIGYIRLLATGWLTMGIFGIKAFRWLLTAAFKTFDGILAAAEKGLGWVPKLGGKIKGARAAFDEFSDATVGKLKTVENALIRARDKANELGRDRTATITITTVYATRNKAAEATPGRGPEYGDGVTGGPDGRRRGRMVTPRLQDRSSAPMPERIAIDDEVDPAGKRAASKRREGETIHTHVYLSGREIAEAVHQRERDDEARL